MPIDVGSALYLSYTYYILLLMYLQILQVKTLIQTYAAITCRNYTEGSRLTRILGLGNTVLHEICVNGTVLWSPTNTYISQKTW